MLYKKSIRHPIVFGLQSGKTEYDDDIVSINRCIGLILTSAKYELFGDPSYGSRLYELLFEQYSDSLDSKIKEEIVSAISTYETRVVVSEQDITITHNENTDRNSYNITINYRLSNSDQAGSAELIMEERGTNGQ